MPTVRETPPSPPTKRQKKSRAGAITRSKSSTTTTTPTTPPPTTTTTTRPVSVDPAHPQQRGYFFEPTPTPMSPTTTTTFAAASTAATFSFHDNTHGVDHPPWVLAGANPNPYHGHYGTSSSPPGVQPHHLGNMPPPPNRVPYNSPVGLFPTVNSCSSSNSTIYDTHHLGHQSSLPYRPHASKSNRTSRYRQADWFGNHPANYFDGGPPSLPPSANGYYDHHHLYQQQSLSSYNNSNTPSHNEASLLQLLSTSVFGKPPPFPTNQVSATPADTTPSPAQQKQQCKNGKKGKTTAALSKKKQKVVAATKQLGPDDVEAVAAVAHIETAPDHQVVTSYGYGKISPPFPFHSSSASQVLTEPATAASYQAAPRVFLLLKTLHCRDREREDEEPASSNSATTSTSSTSGNAPEGAQLLECTAKSMVCGVFTSLEFCQLALRKEEQQHAHVTLCASNFATTSTTNDANGDANSGCNNTAVYHDDGDMCTTLSIQEQRLDMCKVGYSKDEVRDWYNKAFYMSSSSKPSRPLGDEPASYESVFRA